MRNRATGVALGLLAAVAILAFQGIHRHAPGYRLLSESSGSIRTVALQYTLDSCRFTNPCYRAFLSKLEPGVEIIGVCGSPGDAQAFRRAVREWRIPRPERIRTVVVGQPITGWCKDRFLVAGSPPGALICPSLFEAASPGRIADREIVPALARAFPRRFWKAPIPLKFDAGDILATDSHVIVSDTLWNRNSRPGEFRRLLESAFAGKLVWLRGAPDHHIGMFAAPLDEKTVMVGDPDLGRRLWSPRATRNLGRPDFSPAAVTPFRKAADQLRRAGFRVIPLPTAVLDTKVYVSYTNAILETRGPRRIAYMPWYDQPELDQAAAKAYRDAGWGVIPIPVKSVYQFRGTIGCLVNVVERG